MKTITEKEFNQAQLHKFFNNNKDKIIYLNRIPYKVHEAYLNEKNQPYIGLLTNIEDKTRWTTISLSLIDREYHYYNSLTEKDRIHIFNTIYNITNP